MTSKLTLSSWVLLALTGFTVAVALYFNNPLLVYTAVFLLISNLSLFVWAQTSVRGLAVKRLPPKLAVATQPLDVEIELTNRMAAARFGILGFDLHPKLTPGQDFSPVAFLLAQPGQTVGAGYRVVPPRRGIFRLGPFYLYGGDPFGFYKCWSKVESFTELTVLPCPIQYKMAQPTTVSELMREELGTLPVSGNSTEFLGVRDYVSGEPLKRVHWRTSARMGKLISRQYEMNVAAAISVLLLADESMTAGSAVDNPLEYSITLTASLAFATIGARFQFHYLALTGDGSDHHAGSGQRFYRELAIRLAHLKTAGALDWQYGRKRIAAHLPRSSSLVVFSGDLCAQRQEELSRLAAHFNQMTAVTYDKDSFEGGKRRDARLSMGRGFRIVTVGYRADMQLVLPQLVTRRRIEAVAART